MPNPQELLRLAALGQREAQAEMARRAMALAASDHNPDAAVSAEWWARLAAAHGHDTDTRHLVSILFCKGASAYAQDLDDVAVSYFAEAYARYSDLKERGSPDGPDLIDVPAKLPQGGITSVIAARAAELRSAIVC